MNNTTTRYPPNSHLVTAVPPGGYNIAYGRQQRASNATTLSHQHLIQQQQQQQQQQHYQNSQMSSLHQQQLSNMSGQATNHLMKSQQNLATIFNHHQNQSSISDNSTSNQFTLMRYPPQCLPPLPFDAKTQQQQQQQQRSQLIFTDRLHQHQSPIDQLDDPYYASPYSLDLGNGNGSHSLHSHRAPSSTQGLSLRLDRPNSQSLSAKPSKWRYFYKGDFHARARGFLFRYQLLIRSLLLLLLLSLSLVFIIKFTLFPSTPQIPNSIQQIASPASSASQHQLPLLQQIQYPDQMMDSHWLGSRNTPPSLQLQHQQQQQQQQQQELLKSKLVIGEFVITSQNYSHSPMQRNMLAEKIIKLMDQVFLSTEMRRVYSRMEIPNLRPNKKSGQLAGGVIVECNIILNESILNAAQLFGMSLYDSLVRSNERLSSQPNYIVDKNSIRFNTVPDKDLKSGLVPPELLSASVKGDLGLGPQLTPSIGGVIVEPTLEVPSIVQQQQQQQQTGTGSADKTDLLNKVVWSEWSQWSPCVNKEGSCDTGRIHSRVRKCMVQDTGAQVEPIHCRQRFNMQDLDLEVEECSRICQLQAESQHMSDAPSKMQDAPPTFTLGPPPSLSSIMPVQMARQNLEKPSKSSVLRGGGGAADSAAAAGDYSYQPQESNQQQQQQQQLLQPVVVVSPPTAIVDASNNVTNDIGLAILSTPAMPYVDQSTQLSNSQTSCSNCTSDEICLLLITQKVPFCAKVKDRSDESGCGGWCKAQNQLCQPVGSNAFKCIHDSECLPEEWRCHDSACIPLSKRCDGHANCYDNSDERDCPA